MVTLDGIALLEELNQLEDGALNDGGELDGPTIEGELLMSTNRGELSLLSTHTPILTGVFSRERLSWRRGISGQASKSGLAGIRKRIEPVCL